MKLKRERNTALALTVLLGLSAGYMPSTEAAVRDTAEKAVEQQMEAPVGETLSEKAQRLAHSTVTLTGVDVADGSAYDKKKILLLVPQLKSDKVNVQELSRTIALYNDEGAIKLHVNFQPEGNGYRAVVSAVKGKKVTCGVQFANNGNKYSGEWRGTTTYVNRNLTGRGDTLGAALVSTLSMDKDSAVRQGAVSYRWNLANSGDTLTFSASHSDSKLTNLSATPLFDLSATGKSTRAGVSYQHYFNHSQRERDFLDFGLNYHQTDNGLELTIPGGGAAKINYDLHHEDATLSFNHRDRGVSHNFGYRFGLQGNLAGDKKDFKAMTADADTKYLIFHANANYLKRLSKEKNSWLLSTRAAGQLANKNLISCEKFGVGGMDSVRGFDENIRTADNGVSGSVEFYTPEKSGLRGVAFVDGARIKNHHGNMTTNLASTGLGLRYNTANFSLATDYAWVVHEPDNVKNDPAGHRRWNLWAGLSF